MSDFIFLGSKITADGDCSHEIKRHLLLGRKVMTNLDSIFKSINSLTLSFLHNPTLTSIHDHWKNQGDNIQPWRTPFPIWNQSVVPWPVLIVASWPAYRFLKRQIRWSGIPISFRIFYSLLWSTESYLQLIHAAIQQKPTHYKANTLQLKIFLENYKPMYAMNIYESISH